MIKKLVLMATVTLGCCGLFGCSDQEVSLNTTNYKSQTYPFIQSKSESSIPKMEAKYNKIKSVPYDKNLHYSKEYNYLIGSYCKNHGNDLVYFMSAEVDSDKNIVSRRAVDANTGIMYDSDCYSDYMKYLTDQHGNFIIFNPSIIEEIKNGEHLDYAYLIEDFPEVAEKYNITEIPSIQQGEAVEENKRIVDAKKENDSTDTVYVPVIMP